VTCSDCGALLRGSATEHKPGCRILALIEEFTDRLVDEVLAAAAAREKVHLAVRALPEQRCPHCRGLIDGATCVGKNAAGGLAGYMVVCIVCLGWSVFLDDSGAVRQATRAEIDRAMQSDVLRATYEAAAAYRELALRERGNRRAGWN
jgi:hypothetical protein